MLGAWTSLAESTKLQGHDQAAGLWSPWADVLARGEPGVPVGTDSFPTSLSLRVSL